MIKPREIREEITTKSGLNEELKEFLKANTSIEPPDESDIGEVRKNTLKAKKVISTSLSKQRAVNKKHVHIKTIKHPNKFASLEADRIEVG